MCSIIKHSLDYSPSSCARQQTQCLRPSTRGSWVPQGPSWSPSPLPMLQRDAQNPCPPTAAGPSAGCCPGHSAGPGRCCIPCLQCSPGSQSLGTVGFGLKIRTDPGLSLAVEDAGDSHKQANIWGQPHVFLYS